MEEIIVNRVRVRIESYNHRSLNFAQKYIINTLKISSKILFINLISLPMTKKIYCVLRSPHVDKDSREHFEIRTHKRILDIYYNSKFNIVNFFDFINLNLSPEIFFRVIAI
uniref:Ribosomal protein S10 n=1 Tax=Nitzschia sp. PL3-2 TaxID=2083271 RepID=A0A2Z5ZAC7_9STRA|nr:ribosomal protein S10 [Nitzschia sp. PL3-2]BBC77452.1 ribosomal protein S10 [Nitzschia sp. PL3-2]